MVLSSGMSEWHREQDRACNNAWIRRPSGLTAPQPPHFLPPPLMGLSHFGQELCPAIVTVAVRVWYSVRVLLLAFGDLVCSWS